MDAGSKNNILTYVSFGTTLLDRNLQVAIKAFATCVERGGASSIKQELTEVQELRMKTLSQRIGLTDLRIMEEYSGHCGPGCVVWECGVFLSWYMVNNMAGKLAGII